MKSRILIIDDKKSIRKLLSEHLGAVGYEVETAADGPSGLSLFNERVYEIVITDVRMPGGLDGLDILREIKEISPETVVILITAFADVDDAVSALKSGAADYLKKPFKLDDVETALEKALVTKRLMEENRLLRREVEKKYNFSNIIAGSEPMKKVFETIERVAPSSSTALISGETGTGKELVAWAIHDNGPRRERPFVVVNCAAIPRALLESELFGHLKGSFTDARYTKKGRFEEANEGTVFMDEVGELPLDAQVKLLRVLENGEINRIGENRARMVDVRVIAATNADLSKGVDEGRFRKDLYFRLNVLPVNLPPLRERGTDAALLLRHFLDLTCSDNKIPLKSFSRGAADALASYDWPGNVRELHNLVERCVLMSKGSEITLDDLPDSVGDGSRGSMKRSAPELEDDLPMKAAVDKAVAEVESKMIKNALERADGNKDKAAKLLDISRRSFFYKLKQYDIK